MASFNRVILIGNLTRDVELKYTQGGLAIAEIGLAVNDKRKKGEEWVDEVTYVNVTYFGKVAEIINEYLSKGSPIFVEGRLKLDTWEKDGKKHYKLHVIGEKMQMLGGRKDGSGGSGGSRSASSSSQSSSSDGDWQDATDDSEIPF